MKRLLTVVLSLSICASPIMAMEATTAATVATASMAVSSSSATATRLSGSSHNWFRRNPVLTGLAIAALVVGGGIKVWNTQKEVPVIAPSVHNAPSNAVAKPNIYAPIVSGLPFQEKDQELDIYKYFDVQVGMSGDWIEDLNNKGISFNYPSTFNKSDSNCLFKAYPILQEKIPYKSVADLPTPIAKLEDLSKKSGVAVYVKQDAFVGGVDSNGNHKPWANKGRKGEFLAARAAKYGFTKALTLGCVGSNHAVTMASQLSQMGMQVFAMLKHQPASLTVRQNLLFHLLYEIELHYSPNNDIRKLSALHVWLENYKKDGMVPYIIPTGGSNKYGALGFVNAAFELAQQIKEGLMPMPTHIYVATGSCGTTAGLLLGCKAAGITAQIVAVAVEPDEDPTFAQQIDVLFKETNQYLHELDNSFPIYTYSEKDLRIDLNFTGPEYGIFTPEGLEAAQVFGQNAQVSLEGTYTAKAFAGLLHDIKAMPQATVLFWNTYFGFDFSAQLSGLDYKKLPRVFHDYFDDKNLQPLAQKK